MRTEVGGSSPCLKPWGVRGCARLCTTRSTRGKPWPSRHPNRGHRRRRLRRRAPPTEGVVGSRLPPPRTPGGPSGTQPALLHGATVLGRDQLPRGPGPGSPVGVRRPSTPGTSGGFRSGHFAGVFRPAGECPGETLRAVPLRAGSGRQFYGAIDVPANATGLGRPSTTGTSRTCEASTAPSAIRSSASTFLDVFRRAFGHLTAFHGWWTRGPVRGSRSR